MTIVEDDDPRVRKDPVRPGEICELQIRYWQDEYEEMKRQRDMYKEEYERLLEKLRQSGQVAI